MSSQLNEADAIPVWFLLFLLFLPMLLESLIYSFVAYQKILRAWTKLVLLWMDYKWWIFILEFVL